MLVFWQGLGHNLRVVLRVPAALLAGLCSLAACVPLIDPIASSTDGDTDSDSDSDASSETDDASETDDDPPTHPCGPVKVFVSQVIDGVLCSHVGFKATGTPDPQWHGSVGNPAADEQGVQVSDVIGMQVSFTGFLLSIVTGNRLTHKPVWG